MSHLSYFLRENILRAFYVHFTCIFHAFLNCVLILIMKNISKKKIVISNIVLKILLLNVSFLNIFKIKQNTEYNPKSNLIITPLKDFSRIHIVRINTNKKDDFSVNWQQNLWIVGWIGFNSVYISITVFHSD